MPPRAGEVITPAQARAVESRFGTGMFQEEIFTIGLPLQPAFGTIVATMILDPVDLALRHICQTRNLLESLITSSESFEYHKAKEALKGLDRMRRELAKVRAALRIATEPKASNVVRLFEPR